MKKNPEQPATPLLEQQRSYIDDEIRSKQDQAWFGTMTLTFHAGGIKRLQLSESRIPPQK